VIEPLRTARLSLEPLTVEHADMLFAGLSDDRIYQFIEEQRPKDLAQVRQRYARLASLRSPDCRQYWLNWAVSLCDAPCYVGYIQATVAMNGDAFVGYVIFPSMWGRGYATEAVQAMMDFLRVRYSTRKFSASVDTRNDRSVRVLNRLGYSLVASSDQQTLSAAQGSNDALYVKVD
jgi:RimJ/RimL family protein N-acetyltransferase